MEMGFLPLKTPEYTFMVRPGVVWFYGPHDTTNLSLKYQLLEGF